MSLANRGQKLREKVAKNINNMPQKGRKPSSLVGVNYPPEVRDAELQSELHPKGFAINQRQTPTIELSISKSGVEGRAKPTSGKPTREGYDISPTNPEANMHDQFVNSNAIEHSSGAFNS